MLDIRDAAMQSFEIERLKRLNLGRVKLKTKSAILE